jgi:Zn-finger nucleic acid-binding protein
MIRSEPRLPCPVCLGVKMVKARVGRSGELMLDHCGRCGGIWFEPGEVQDLRRREPNALFKAIPIRAEVSRAPCHGCQTIVSRDVDVCQVCGRAQRISCPKCQRTMRVTSFQGYAVDVCHACKGVWFDHHELSLIWNRELGTAIERHRHNVASYQPADLLIDAVLFTPDLAIYSAYAAGHAVIGSAEFLGAAPEVIGPAAGAVGDAAASVFEIIVEIIGGIFS